MEYSARDRQTTSERRELSRSLKFFSSEMCLKICLCIYNKMLAWRKLKSELDEGKRSGEEIGWLLSL